METRKYVYMLLVVCLTLTYFICVKMRRLMPVDDHAPSLRTYFEGGGSWKAVDSSKREKQLHSWKPMPSCSFRRIVKKDRNLRKRFNFSVPLLQWAGSFNQSEWQRLQHAPLPFGWRDLSHNVVRNTLSLLHDSTSSRLFEREYSGQCVRCAVVGNGGILKGSGQGKAIDSHDYVFRMNGAITKHFEEDVGTKTSFYGFTTNTLKNSLKAYWSDGFTRVPQDPGICYIFIPANIRDYVMLAAAVQGVSVPSGYDKGDLPSKYFGYKRPVQQFRMIHPSFIEYVTKRFLNSPLLKMRHGDVYMPSTGALMLMAALHACDQVSAYGFITQNYEDFSEHYYDAEKKPLLFYANHDLLMEGELWEFLNSSSVLWLYQRDSMKALSFIDWLN
ncbi:alpha-N-acetylgalactosaminide alpha-2,6-sialyltransferase 2 isoform X1 [Colossoma macropomum]|uniref:alpha-N-acetylgalactosaminide alpha-2,6-sialyltransferase 2 isoform X1 n=1 Tax=Colossoma macropomum TaxID=42526 RepID=UPI0018650732|nr:alpha-N-acetylgalactosaminide alpha-2,6-sialyltransferase 2 isoform X1 [Colossoma macropomum]